MADKKKKKISEIEIYREKILNYGEKENMVLKFRMKRKIMEKWGKCGKNIKLRRKFRQKY